MDEFIHKTVSDEIQLDRVKAKPVACVVTRTRTSNGFASIEVRIDKSVTLSFTTDTHGAEYEQVARQVAALLLRIADNPCTLPGAA